MRIRTGNRWLLGCLATAALTLSAGQASGSQEKGEVRKPNKAKSHTGEFAGLGEGSFTMTIGGKNRHTHKVTEETKVTIDGRKAALGDLRKGDRIEVFTGEGNVALKVEATRKNATNGQAQRTPQQERVALGVRLDTSPTTGVLIREIQSRGPASQAGLRSGDYILSINGKTIDSLRTFDQTMMTLKPGDRAKMTIWRNNQRQQVAVNFPQGRRAAYRPENENGANGKGWLGVMLRSTDEGQKGVRVTRIYPSGPGARAGLQSGDVLVQVGGKQVTSTEEAARLISDAKPNEEIKLVVLRGDQQQTLTAILADRGDYVDDRTPPQGENERGAGNDYRVPDHAMMLEQHRRFAEQHQRIEQKLDEVLKELKALKKQMGQNPKGTQR